LVSTIPPLTPPAFASAMTGKNPGKHNIYDFVRIPRDGYRRAVINSTHMRGNKLWNIVNHYGRKAGIVHFPASYPPEQVDGFLVGGILTPKGADSHTWPPELGDELRREIPGYRIYRGRQHLQGDLHGYLEDLIKVTRIHADEALYLLEQKAWDFFFLMFKYTDGAKHIYWKFWDREHPAHPGPNQFEDAILRVYKEVDAFLGRVLERYPDTTLMVFSDHGFMPVHTFVHLQNWLEREGFLAVRRDERQRMRVLMNVHHFGLRRDNLVGWLKRHRLTWLPKLFPERLKNKVPRTRLGMNEFARFIDWKRTRAYQLAESGRGINLHIQGREPLGCVPESGPEYERLRREIMDRLAGLRDPRTGETVVDKMWTRDELYHGPYVRNAPDILIELKKGYCFSEGFGRSVFVKAAREPFDKSANHELEGVLFVRGPGVRPGVDLDALGAHCNVVDVAPTLLYAMDLPVQTNMDGRVIEEIYEPDYLAARPISTDQVPEPPDPDDSYDFSDAEAGSVQDELKALGYL
jgi:predicted AlkP superfamily phosphohydrolase/phosphomutase